MFKIRRVMDGGSAESGFSLAVLNDAWPLVAVYCGLLSVRFYESEQEFKENRRKVIFLANHLFRYRNYWDSEKKKMKWQCEFMHANGVKDDPDLITYINQRWKKYHLQAMSRHIRHLTNEVFNTTSVVRIDSDWKTKYNRKSRQDRKQKNPSKYRRLHWSNVSKPAQQYIKKREADVAAKFDWKKDADDFAQQLANENAKVYDV